MTLKIIHIINDEKFLDAAYTAFEAAYPNKNEFIVFANSKELKHLKLIKPKFLPTYYLYSAYLIQKSIQADIVIFHSLHEGNLRILNALPKTIKTIWLGWGYDYYDLINAPLLKEKTLKYQQSLSDRHPIKLKSIIKNIIVPKVYKRKLINKIDIFSPVLYEDYLLVKQSINNFTLKYVSWNYGTLEDDLIRGFEGKSVNGNNILLGNSASLTNNHLDALELLKTINLGPRKVVAPLSYGDLAYKNYIIGQSKATLGSAFTPLIDFMPIDDYIEILQSCSIVIMNHLRQQALGNIVIALYLGAKVFLNKENPIYQFFINLDAVIYDIESLGSEMDSKLTQPQIDKNRQILQEYWGREVILDKTTNIIKKALSSH